MRRTALLCALVAQFATAGASMATDAGQPAAGDSGALDGRVFEATMVVDQYDAPFEDRITFKDGMFHSEECQRACDFGWTPYYTRREGDAIAFVVETACSDSPQSARWEGRVVGDRIEAEIVWTVERFYWTVQRNATASGSLAAATGGGAVVLTE